MGLNAEIILYYLIIFSFKPCGEEIVLCSFWAVPVPQFQMKRSQPWWKLCVIVIVRNITKYLEFIECIITIANVTKNGLIIYQKWQSTWNMQWLHFLRVSLQNVPSGVLDSTKQLACFLKRQHNAILDGCGSSESQKELERETGGTQGW